MRFEEIKLGKSNLKTSEEMRQFFKLVFDCQALLNLIETTKLVEQLTLRVLFDAFSAIENKLEILVFGETAE